MNNLNPNLDYLTLGSIGFHQVGQIHDTEKRLAENSVLQELITAAPFTVPEFLTGVARLQIKTFTHDFGSYDELCIIYNYTTVNEWEAAEEEEVNELFDRFWSWVNLLETFNWESDDLWNRCEQRLESIQKQTDAESL